MVLATCDCLINAHILTIARNCQSRTDRRYTWPSQTSMLVWLLKDVEPNQRDLRSVRDAPSVGCGSLTQTSKDVNFRRSALLLTGRSQDPPNTAHKAIAAVLGAGRATGVPSSGLRSSVILDLRA